ncbi:MAG: Gfo/Idh/MocA family oxidoreductase [Chloroflexi bacterium]|nr:Gfo/Idh/MocA family oxidoreductase [Chloroflexota bacterium]
MIRVGILSCAHPHHAASYTHHLGRIDGVEVAAIYDEEAERGGKFAATFGVNDFYLTPEPLLAREDIQAVVVCSANDRHAPLVIAAARAGKHVLCEKPIATRLDDARAMIEACRSAGAQLHIPFVSRFYPMVQEAKRVIASGEIGPVYGMVGGNRGLAPLPPSYPAWITDPIQAGGGAVIDHSVHVTDAMRFVLDSEVESVFAESGTLFQPGLSVDDSGLILLKFRNGVAASVDPIWSIPANHPFHYDFYLRILGAEGLIALDDTQQALRVSSDSVPGRGAYLEPFGVDVDAAMVRHFVHCIRRGEALPPYASGEDGLRALEIALAAYESARSGQPVTLPLP